eukprot:COSAG06_NODE_2138_length_7498_cov_24.950554_9_plen_113_part_00
MVPTWCNGVIISNVSIMAPTWSPNTDGIEPLGCRNVRVSGCYVHNGDDCLTVKGGCEDVLIVDSYFASGHGASVGSVTDIGVKNVSQCAPHVDLLPCFADTSFTAGCVCVCR